MSQIVINAHIIGQTIQMTNLPLIASGIKGALSIACDFSDEWSGYGKTAVFYRNEAEVYHIPLQGGAADVPHEVLEDKGFFFFGIMGGADNTLTTEVLRISVVKGAITTATASPADPTPDIYQQLMAAYNKVDARLTELAQMRGSGWTFDDTVGDEYILGNIYNNGTAAYVDLLISGLSLIAGGYHYTDYCVPPYHAPLCPVYLETTNPDINVTIEKADETHEGWSRILIENVGNTMYTTDMETSCRGHYPLNAIWIDELADARVGADGWTYSTAGEAVRGQIKQLNEKVEARSVDKELIDKLAPAFTESGPVVTCTPVEGYPLEAEWESKNLFDISKVPLTEASDTAPYIAEVTENSIKIVTKEGYTGNGYVGTAKPLKEFCPGLQAGDTFTISGTTESKCEYIYLPDDYGSALNFGRSYVATEEMLNARVIFYGLHNGTTGNQGVGTCTISNLQIERGTTATAYEPYAETATITRCGKNLLNITKAKSGNATVNGNTIRVTKSADGGRSSGSMPLRIPANTNFTLSGRLLETNGTTTNPWTIFCITESGKYHGVQQSNVSSDGTFSWSRTFTEAITRCYIQVEVGEEAGVYVEFTDLQLALGSKTTYEPYNGGTFAPGEAIPAIPGVNTIFADTGLVTVTGKADPVAIIADLYDKINQLQANAVNNA